MNPILFAFDPYFTLNSLCFVLTVLCGYLITKHFIDEHKTSGIALSVFVGAAIGVLLILDDGNVRNNIPQFGRIIIGMIGSGMGHFLYRIKANTKKKDETINDP